MNPLILPGSVMGENFSLSQEVAQKPLVNLLSEPTTASKGYNPLQKFHCTVATQLLFCLLSCLSWNPVFFFLTFSVKEEIHPPQPLQFIAEHIKFLLPVAVCYLPFYVWIHVFYVTCLWMLCFSVVVFNGNEWLVGSKSYKTKAFVIITIIGISIPGKTGLWLLWQNKYMYIHQSRWNNARHMFYSSLFDNCI